MRDMNRILLVLTVPNPFLFHYFLWKCLFWFKSFLFKPPFPGTRLGYKQGISVIENALQGKTLLPKLPPFTFYLYVRNDYLNWSGCLFTQKEIWIKLLSYLENCTFLYVKIGITPCGESEFFFASGVEKNATRIK